MAGATPDAIERARRDAAHSLPDECQSDFLRLSRSLIHGPTFQWLLVEAPDEHLRRRVMAALESVLRAARLSSSTLPLSQKIADVAELERRLASHAQRSVVVHVIGRPGWFDAARWDAFNARRERLASDARARLVFWLDAAAIELASRSAPDLWAWRGGVYAFVAAGDVASLTTEPVTSVALNDRGSDTTMSDTRSRAEKRQRIAEIQTWLASDPPDDLRAEPLDEWGRLLFEAGDYDAALQHWRSVEQPFHLARGDARAAAGVSGKIADALRRQGRLDEALRLYREEALPAFDRLGDLRARAVTLGRMAEVLQLQGDLDAALALCRDELLPACERLGDVRERALAQGRIADLLQQRGQPDEALELLRLEVLPVFERLGDVRERALAQGRIADVLQAQGRFDEALRIRREEQLPVFDRLGDTRERALTQWRIAQLLLARTPPDRQAASLLRQALADLQRLGLPEAVTLAEQMRQLGIALSADGSAA